MSRMETMSAEMSIPTLLWLELIMGGGAMKDWCKNELTTIIWLRNDVSPDMIGLGLSAYNQTHHSGRNNLGQSCTYKWSEQVNKCMKCYVQSSFLSPISTHSPLLQVNWSSEQVVKDIIVFPKSPKQKKSLWISHSWGPESKIWLCSTVSTNIYTHKQILENGCTGCIHPGVVGHPHGPQLLLWVIGDYGVLLSLEHDIACLIIHNLTIRP